MNQRPLPWDEWSAAFRKNMPAAIKQHIKDKQGDVSNKGKPTRKMIDFLKDITKRRVLQENPQGKKNAGAPLQSESQLTNTSSSSNTSGNKNGGSASTSSSARTSSDRRMAEGSGRNASRRNISLESLQPSYTWGRGVDLGMDGTFTKYISSDNRLLLNQDCGFVKEVVDYWVKRKEPSHRDAVVEKVHEHFAAQAAETVIVLRKNAGAEGWPEDKIEEMLRDSHVLSIGATARSYMQTSLNSALKHIPNRTIET